MNRLTKPPSLLNGAVRPSLRMRWPRKSAAAPQKGNFTTSALFVRSRIHLFLEVSDSSIRNPPDQQLANSNAGGFVERSWSNQPHNNPTTGSSRRPGRPLNNLNHTAQPVDTSFLAALITQRSFAEIAVAWQTVAQIRSPQGRSPAPRRGQVLAPYLNPSLLASPLLFSPKSTRDGMRVESDAASDPKRWNAAGFRLFENCDSRNCQHLC